MAVENLDQYEIDPERVKQEAEKKQSTDLPKVKWHNLPEGEAISTWRIFPFPKRRTFYVKVTKHWDVPGMKGSVTCPRSFEDPENPGKKYRCAICEERWKLEKSDNKSDNDLAKAALRASTSYYTNAINIDRPEDGVGVLNMPYGVFKTLFDWLSMPKFNTFASPRFGRNIIITSTLVVGSSIPGQPGKQKRDYTVTPDDATPLADFSLLETIYDLDTIVGIPTFEFTKSCLDRILSGDPTAGALPEGVPLYRKQLASSNAAPNNVGEHTTEYTEAPPAKVSAKVAEPKPVEVPIAKTEAPIFAKAVTTTAYQGGVVTPTEQTGPDGQRICFGIAYNDSNKTCLKCPEIDNCEVAVLKAQRVAKKATPEAPAPTPSIGGMKSEAEIQDLMLKALGKKK